MNKFPFLSNGEREIYFSQVGAEKNLPPALIEKDFWVCWVLMTLFSSTSVADHLTFKGGTSLSKGWGLIKRFSEDIDLTINREFFGFGAEESPELAVSASQQARKLKALRHAARLYVSDKLLKELDRIFHESLPDSDWSLKLDGDDPDQQTLLFKYPSAWPAPQSKYVQAVVKIEFGARSDPWPSSIVGVRSFIGDLYPDALEPKDILINILAPERTFWEKAMLLHEERFRPVDKPRGLRMARHYYDLWSLEQNGIAEKALSDSDLFHQVLAHRQIFFKQSWVDYTTLKKGSLMLEPQEAQLGSWMADYEAMGEMFLGAPPTFTEIMSSVRRMQEKFNT